MVRFCVLFYRWLADCHLRKGNAESGTVFQSKSRLIKALLERAFPTFPEPGFNPMFPGEVELFYPTAPHRIQPASWTKEEYGSHPEKQKDFDSWTWAFGDYWKHEVVGYEQSVRHMVAVMKKEGPFDGIVGFSAGAGMALTLVSLSKRRGTGDPKFMEALAINPEDIPPPFQFAVCCSGFIIHHPRYRSLYYPKIQTPILIFIGSFDPIVPGKAHLEVRTQMCERSDSLSSGYTLRAQRKAVSGYDL
jgi:hypothetical protein